MLATKRPAPFVLELPAAVPVPVPEEAFVLAPVLAALVVLACGRGSEIVSMISAEQDK